MDIRQLVFKEPSGSRTHLGRSKEDKGSRQVVLYPPAPGPLWPYIVSMIILLCVAIAAFALIQGITSPRNWSSQGLAAASYWLAFAISTAGFFQAGQFMKPLLVWKKTLRLLSEKDAKTLWAFAKAGESVSAQGHSVKVVIQEGGTIRFTARLYDGLSYQLFKDIDCTQPFSVDEAKSMLSAHTKRQDIERARRIRMEDERERERQQKVREQYEGPHSVLNNA